MQLRVICVLLSACVVHIGLECNSDKEFIVEYTMISAKRLLKRNFCLQNYDN